MTKTILFDTTVFIDYLRGAPQAQLWVDKVLSQNIQGGLSIITEAELWAGVKDRSDEKRHKSVLAYFIRFGLPVTVARRAGAISYSLKRKRKQLGIGIGDFIIAATAEHSQIDLLTRNTRHFHAIPLNGVKIITYSL